MEKKEFVLISTIITLGAKAILIFKKNGVYTYYYVMRQQKKNW